jgi:hypothetical protein
MLTDIIDKLRETPNYSTTSINSLVALVKREIDSVSLPMISQEARKQVRAIMDQGLGWVVAQYEEEVRQEYTKQARRAEASMLKTKKGYVICYDARDTFLRMAFDVPKMMDTSEYEALSGKALSEMVTWVVGVVVCDVAHYEQVWNLRVNQRIKERNEVTLQRRHHCRHQILEPLKERHNFDPVIVDLVLARSALQAAHRTLCQVIDAHIHEVASMPLYPHDMRMFKERQHQFDSSVRVKLCNVVQRLSHAWRNIEGFSP